VTTLEANRPDPSPEITAQTQSLIAGAPDFYTKLSRITDYIQKNVRYFIVMRGIGVCRQTHAADIFRNRYGDCKDKTTLLISMLQVAGIHAVYMPVDASRGVVDPDDPSLLGNHMITAIEVPADVQDPPPQSHRQSQRRQALLDFRSHQRTHSVGNLPSYLQGSYGTLAAGASSRSSPSRYSIPTPTAPNKMFLHALGRRNIDGSSIPPSASSEPISASSSNTR